MAASHALGCASRTGSSPRSICRRRRSGAGARFVADRPTPLERGTVLKLASVLGLEDNAFIVGGQALNLWAERYAPGRPELIQFGPFTSKDLDYYGHRAAAAKLAEALGGELRVPPPDDHTPNSAVVSAKIDGRQVEIDFLTDVIGVKANLLEREAMELIIPIRGEAVDQLVIPIMHPLHCLQSRVGNIVGLGRSDDISLGQLAASPIVVEAYINEMLVLGDVKEAVATLRALFEYLRSDLRGRSCCDLPMRDPAKIITKFMTDRRLDWRFRWFNLRSMRRTLAAKRLVTLAIKRR